MIAHVARMPPEELLTAVSGAGAGLMLAGAWVMLRLRRGRHPGP
jgi:hypothetical protein